MSKFRDFGGFLGVICKLKAPLSEVDGSVLNSKEIGCAYPRETLAGSDRKTRIDDEKERLKDRVSQAGEIQFC